VYRISLGVVSWWACTGAQQTLVPGTLGCAGGNEIKRFVVVSQRDVSIDLSFFYKEKKKKKRVVV
jgi:hypothetical protein